MNVRDAPRPTECGDTCLLCDQDPDRNALWTNSSTVSLNLERQALQIRGCGDTILAHLPLDETTRLGLESAGSFVGGSQ